MGQLNQKIVILPPLRSAALHRNANPLPVNNIPAFGQFSRKAGLKDELGIQPQTECLFLLKGVLLKPRDVLSSLLYTIIIYIGIIKEITQKPTIFMRKFLRKIYN